MGEDTGGRPEASYLFDIAGTIIDQGGGFWVRIEAWPVTPSDGIPHGIRYSLTLHNADGRRILGFDNAHPTGRRSLGSGGHGNPRPFDHRHRKGRKGAVPYRYRGTYELLTDFFDEVDRTLADGGKR